jgi:hypothetical protein
MTSVPFFEKGKLLKHGDKLQNELKEYVPIDYILENIHNDYINGINFFIIEAATGSGKSYTLPVAFYKFFENNNTIILQPKILTVTQLKEDYTIKDNPAEKYVGKKFELGVNLAIKYSQLNVSCKSKHCLTIGSYGSFLKKITRDPKYIYSFKTIILDEIHEDAPEVIDILLYLYYNKINENKLPIIILTSATLQIKKFNEYFKIPSNNHFMVAGKTYNKNIYYENDNIDNILYKMRDILTNIIKSDELKYDILIFISSNKDIEYYKNNSSIKGLTELDNSVEIIGISRDYIMSHDNDYILYLNNNSNYDLKTRKRQIIFGTNAAETGITINNLKYVINIGYELKKEYVPYLSGYIMYKSFISLASETQRIGRIGRKFDGIAYNLYTEDTKNNLNQYRHPNLITNDLSKQLLKNFNKLKYIENIPIELIYNAVFNLYVLGFLDINDKYNIDNLYECISYTYDTGYIIDGELSNIGVIAKKMFNNMDDIDNDDINLNDIKLMILSVYFNIDLYDITSIISMVKNYNGDINKNTNNDFIELLYKYNEHINNYNNVNNKKFYYNTKFDKVVYIKHKLLKMLYKTGFDITHNNKKRMINKHIVIKYIIEKIFYNAYIDKIIINKKYRNYDVICRTNEECITNQIDIKQNYNNNKYEIKTGYLCIIDSKSINFNDKSYSLIYL